MNWLFNRLREPSSMAGVPLIAYGVDQLFGAGGDQAAHFGAALQDAVPQLLSGNWIGGTLSLAFGIGAILISEGRTAPRQGHTRYPVRPDPRDPYGAAGDDGIY